MQPAKICIVAQNSWGALAGSNRGHVGGAEFQTTFLARWLATRGHEVSLVTWDEGQPDGAVIDGVRVFKMCGASEGLPGLRFVSRWTSLYAALRRADADVYYHNSAEYVTGLVALWCRRNGRRFVYSVASDVACDPRLPAMRKHHERWFYRTGLRRADRILVQTETQRRMLLTGFALESVRVPMPCISAADNTEVEPPSDARSVCWIGRAVRLKRLEWILEIARRLPHIRFHLVVAGNRDPYADELRRRAGELPNVIWRGTVPRSKTMDVYRETACLCCTSEYEGFPNTFLEAWSQGRPVITTFDPDGVVQRERLGAARQTIEELTFAITSVLNPESWGEYARNAAEYFANQHTPEKVMPLMERELLSGQPQSMQSRHAPNQPERVPVSS